MAGISGGTATTWERCTTTCSAKPPVLRPLVTVRLFASVRLLLAGGFSQATSWPCWQAWHCPQVAMSETTTEVPAVRSVTDEPVSATRPAISWPKTTGNSVAHPPSINIKSEWQMAQASTAMRTSSGPGALKVSSSSFAGSPAPQCTAAVIIVPTFVSINPDSTPKIDGDSPYLWRGWGIGRNV